MKKAISLFIFCILSTSAFADNYQIKHLEPLNWWVGMNHPELQLLVNGDNISELTPAIDYAGVKIVSVEKTDNKNYLFINLLIAANTKPGSFTVAFKQGEKVITSANYRLEERIKNSAARSGFCLLYTSPSPRD
jgi:hypothetical protein